MRKKLLLADDSITIQKVVELTFPSDEFEVVTAGNGRIAVDKAATFLPDMVLCDVIMPQMDGYEVCEALRAMPQLNDVPILLLNGAFEPYDAARASAVGALGNVSKPFDPPSLVARVREIMAQRSLLAHEDQLARTIPLDDLIVALPPIEAVTVPQVPAEPSPEDAIEASPEETAPLPVYQDYSYDESDVRPVSTVEVPTGIREIAARSMSLDAPVFQAQEPDVLTGDAEPSGLSETLHGRLDSAEPAGVADEVTMEATEDLTMEMTEDVSLEAAEESAKGVPQTLPPMLSPFAVEAAPSVSNSSDDLGFEPEPSEGLMAQTDPAITSETEASRPDVPGDKTEAPEAFDEGHDASVAVEVLTTPEAAWPADLVQQITRRVTVEVSERLIREIAWEVIPDLAEKLVKAEIERIRARAQSEQG